MSASTETHAATLRLRAMYHRNAATMLDLAASATVASAAVHDLYSAVRASVATEVANHPDLAYLDLQLDGFFGDTP